MSQKKPPSIPPVATTSVPISQPPTEAMVSKLGDGLQAQALSTLQGLQLFAEQRPSAEQALWHKHTKALQALIDALHDARMWANGVVFNPGGYTHTSVALRDAISAIVIPVIEVHLSNVYAREEFRHTSFVSAVCKGKVSGFGWRSYELGLHGLVDIIKV